MKLLATLVLLLGLCCSIKPAYHYWWIESTKAEIKRDRASIDAFHASERCRADIVGILIVKQQEVNGAISEGKR